MRLAPSKIWTIGHSTLGLASFIGNLRAQHVEAIADVRLNPGSKRFPHFIREALTAGLQQANIDYLHLPEMGGRRKARPDSPNVAWRKAAFRGYVDHMETAEFAHGLDKLLQLAAEKRVAVMCAEAVWWQCHRRLLADWLKAKGTEVLHIFSENKIEPHPFMAPAAVIDGQLSYRAPRADATHAELPLI